MAAPTIEHQPATPTHPSATSNYVDNDIFAADVDPLGQSYQHRFSSRFDIEPLDLSSATSPSQLKRTIEAHLQETDRRLLDTQQLGNALVKQREDLNSRLEEVEHYQDEATIPNDLRRRLADIEREHADVGREVARALIGPKLKQDESQLSESAVFSSQATGSPTKVSAPSRRHRNQPSTRAGDLQFAADISTSLLAQVRQLQAAVAERDEAIKRSQAEREVIEQDVLAYSQKIRTLDESEQKYKDENWNLETQKHDLIIAAREAQDKEKRLNANLGVALSEKTRLQNDLDELKVVHSKLAEEHTATRKAHDTEIHGLKRNADVADTERQSLQDKIEELITQNQELAKAVTGRSRSRQISPGEGFLEIPEQDVEKNEVPDDSPPPSPTKATPRHGGLESETLRSSLHHAHRMIQNLKGNIHREKTEKIELKRMLQDARDELEHRRGTETGAAGKRQKTKSEGFKKPLRPDMLGGNRRPRTDIEAADDDWEDHNMENLSHARPSSILQAPRGSEQRLTDLSDAYQTANDTEGTFDTADERNTTESESFMTGAESLAGDSTDELTETEDTASKSGRPASGRVGRSSTTLKSAKDRSSHLSSASTSGDEANDMQTPMQPSFMRFKLRNNRSQHGKQALVAQQSTPDSFRSPSISEDSPATVTTAQSPPTGEQSLFAELGGMDELNSETHSTPARSSTMSSAHSTPGFPYTPSRSNVIVSQSESRPTMVDSSTMTDNVTDESSVLHKPHAGTAGAESERNSQVAESTERALLPSAFPLHQSSAMSPTRQIDSSTQYTPQRGAVESPVRPTSSHITPPKTVWDAAYENSSPMPDAGSSETAGNQHNHLGHSGVLAQDSFATHSASKDSAELHRQLEDLRTDLVGKDSEMEALRANHATSLAAVEQQMKDMQVAHTVKLEEKQTEILGHQEKWEQKQAELHQTRDTHERSLASINNDMAQVKSLHGLELETLRNTVSSLAKSVQTKETELEETHRAHSENLTAKQNIINDLQAQHVAEVDKLNEQIARHRQDAEGKHIEIQDLHNSHTAALAAKEVQLDELQKSHQAETAKLDRQITDHQSQLHMRQTELEILRVDHATALQQSQSELEQQSKSHATEIEKLRKQAFAHQDELSSKQTELDTLHSSHAATLAVRQVELDEMKSSHTIEIEKLKELNSGHADEVERKRHELDQLRVIHGDELEKLKSQLSGHSQEIGSKQSELESLRQIHETELENLRRQISRHVDELSNKQSHVDGLEKAHLQEMDLIRSQMSTQSQELGSKRSELSALQLTYEQDVEALHRRIATHAKDLERSQAELDALRKGHEKDVVVLQDTHSKGLSLKQTEIDNMQRAHNDELAKLQEEMSAHKQHLSSSQASLEAARSAHGQETERLQALVATLEESQRLQRSELDELRSNHKQEAETLQSEVASKNQDIERLQAVYDKDISALQERMLIKTRELEEIQRQLKALEARIAHTTPSFSAILSQETLPVPQEPVLREFAPSVDRPSTPERPRTAEKIVGGGLFASAAGALGLAVGRKGQQDEIEQSEGPSKAKGASNPPFTAPIRAHSPSNRNPGSPTQYTGRQNSRSRDVPSIMEDPDSTDPSSILQRPESAGSMRASSLVSQNHPPLPSDHKDVIAKANNQVGSPTRREASMVKSGGVMGPPAMPASAMRRPKTPSESVKTASRVGNNGKRGVGSSRASRRSSVSSFASELDERFNIRTDQQAATHGFESASGTDPRMIQAITQTMIGEYLWKYTRKAGSKEMSATRHRRYFWVHPYTKTLYWSDQDPQTAGRSELKAKSVAIESVRVVSDDNPMPPGLHRKSLEITTPGRKVKFTASTGQRHETWFNALSYLLHRGAEQDLSNEYGTGGNDITKDDVAEFGVNGYSARLVPNDRTMSMSSYNSRTTNNTSRKVRASVPTEGTLESSRAPTPQTQTTSQYNDDTIRGNRLEAPKNADKDRTIRASSRTRISKMFGSVTSRTRSDQPQGTVESSSQSRPNSSIYDASVISNEGNKEEDESRKRQAKEDKPGLEDVRACCDGKHNVSTLTHRQASSASTHNRLSNAINRSMSRRT